MIKNFDNWLNESVTPEESKAFLEKFIRTLRSEGRKFGRFSVKNTGSFNNMEEALAAYNTIGGGLKKHVKNGPIDDIVIFLSQYGDAYGFFLFNQNNIELVPAMENDPGHQDQKLSDTINSIVKEVYDRLLKQYYPAKHISRKRNTQYGL